MELLLIIICIIGPLVLPFSGKRILNSFLGTEMASRWMKTAKGFSLGSALSRAACFSLDSSYRPFQHLKTP